MVNAAIPEKVIVAGAAAPASRRTLQSSFPTSFRSGASSATGSARGTDLDRVIGILHVGTEPLDPLKGELRIVLGVQLADGLLGVPATRPGRGPPAFRCGSYAGGRTYPSSGVVGVPQHPPFYPTAACNAASTAAPTASGPPKTYPWVPTANELR